VTKVRPTNDQLTHFGKVSNHRNSATHQPIPFMFGSRVGFSGMVDRMAPFLVGSNPRSTGGRFEKLQIAISQQRVI